MKGFLRAGLIVVIATFASGCAASSYGAGALKRHLVAAGVAPAAAECVVGHMVSRFGDIRLAARADASAAELKAERAILRRCGVTAISPR